MITGLSALTRKWCVCSCRQRCLHRCRDRGWANQRTADPIPKAENKRQSRGKKMSTSFFPRSPLQSGFALVNINHSSFPGLELERANSSFFLLFIFPFASPYAVTDLILKCIVLRPPPHRFALCEHSSKQLCRWRPFRLLVKQVRLVSNGWGIGRCACVPVC